MMNGLVSLNYEDLLDEVYLIVGALTSDSLVVATGVVVVVSGVVDGVYDVVGVVV